MEPRLDAYKRVPGALPAMRGLETWCENPVSRLRCWN